MQVYKTKQGDNLSSIIYSYYGKINSNILAAVLAANQNIADIPLVFPPDVTIHLPKLPETTDIPVKTLWD